MKLGRTSSLHDCYRIILFVEGGCVEFCRSSSETVVTKNSSTILLESFIHVTGILY